MMTADLRVGSSQGLSQGFGWLVDGLPGNADAGLRPGYEARYPAQECQRTEQSDPADDPGR